jgi:DNA polymerase III delta subunit
MARVTAAKGRDGRSAGKGSSSALPPLFDLAAFRRQIAQKTARGYLFFGPERTEYLHRLAIDELKRAFGRDQFEVCFGPHRGEPPLPLEQLFGELIAPGLFGGCKLVAIYDARSTAEQLTWFERALTGGGAGTIALSIAGGRLPDKLAALFTHHGEVIRTRELYATPPPWGAGGAGSSELARWLQLRARDQGRQLLGDAADRLIELVGAELALLDTELGKLAALIPGQDITRAQLDELVGASRTFAGFELTEPLLKRDARAALTAIRRATLGCPDSAALLLQLLSAIKNQLSRELLPAIMVAERERRAPSADALQVACGLSPFNARRTAEVVARFRSRAELLAVRHAIFRADRDFKQGLAEPEWLLERLALELAKPTAAASLPPGGRR